MTIETATPTSAETVAALFDQLIEAVAARVIAKLDPAMNDWAMYSMQLDQLISNKVDHKFDQMDMDELVRESLGNIDLDDIILEQVQELSFEVSVSR